MKRTVQSVVPASTSNLGPGFDLLGLALDLYLRMTVTVEGEFVMSGTASPDLTLSWDGEGGDPPSAVPLDEGNLAVRGLATIWEEAGVALDGRVTITARSEIPVSRGLGASGAAIVAGLLAGGHLCESELEKEQMLPLAASLEGHPDNVAPSLHGGLVAAAPVGTEERILVERDTLFEEYLLAAVVPDLALTTRLARDALPSHVTHREAVSSQQRSFFLYRALTEGRSWDLRSLVTDTLHQPHRAPLIPAFDDLIECAYKQGAQAAWLSGSGPSILVLLEGTPEKAEAIGRSLEARWAEEEVASKTLILGPDNWGAVVHEVGE
ncbi:MAG: homoserine kinase [bacterium]